MKKLRNEVVILALLLVLFSATGSMAAEGWKFLPFNDAEWSPEFTLAFSYGRMNLDTDLGSSDPALGLQFSLNCPWFTPPQGMIRQQFNYNRFDEGQLEIATLEMNPRYYLGDGNFTFGVGPGIGYVWVDQDGVDSEGLWAFQLGADIEYRKNHLFLGVGSRYQITQNDKIGTSNDNGMDNWLTTVKAGVNF